MRRLRNNKDYLVNLRYLYKLQLKNIILNEISLDKEFYDKYFKYKY